MDKFVLSECEGKIAGFDVYMRADIKEFIKQIEEYCYKNNTIPMKDLFKNMKNSKLNLAITDGGWVNVMSLLNFIKEKAGGDLYE